MVPLPRFRRLCDQQFAVHEEYVLVILEERSHASHNHYFAAVKEGFDNLAEEWAVRFPSREHLRKWCLVQEGYCTMRDVACQDDNEALKLATVVRQLNEYAVIVVSGNVVKIFEPFSQSRPAMKKDEFEESKRKVLDRIASMSRTTASELNRNAGRSA